MKHFLGTVVAVAAVGGAVVVSQQPPAQPATAAGILQVQPGERNPWTHLRMINGEDVFRFAIVSDRTGGHREKIFSRAVEQLNTLQPEFVISVGDLIEGYSTDPERLANEWREFQSFTSRLQMPFFYVAGNHDIANQTQRKVWEEKFGRPYYHFVYKGVLFLMLCSEDPPPTSSISDEQAEWVNKTLEENASAHWTVVALHKPIWTANIQKNGWEKVEKALAGRSYTVFAGHVHRYQKFIRNGMNYYQLATTGGGSRLRGVRYGEFDHLVWVTMKKSGPVLANLMLDGIYPEDLRIPETNEPVTQIDRKPTHPAKGFVYFDGIPAAGATISFYGKVTGIPGWRFVSDAIVDVDGSFTLSTYTSGDGVPVGEYLVTVSCDVRYGPVPEVLCAEMPAKYAKPDTSGLTATIKSGKNELSFNLKK